MLWSGPYILTEKVSDILFKLRRLSDNKLISVPVHVNIFNHGNCFQRENEVLPDLPVSEEQFNPDMNEDDIPPHLTIRCHQIYPSPTPPCRTNLHIQIVSQIQN